MSKKSSTPKTSQTPKSTPKTKATGKTRQKNVAEIPAKPTKPKK